MSATDYYGALAASVEMVRPHSYPRTPQSIPLMDICVGQTVRDPSFLGRHHHLLSSFRPNLIH